jgi:hypothetical protein|tara:strand:+ start:1622 stop:1741 length:120 start_codon:yes stop_codon:yes gene_type:complete
MLNNRILSFAVAFVAFGAGFLLIDVAIMRLHGLTLMFHP